MPRITRIAIVIIALALTLSAIAPQHAVAATTPTVTTVVAESHAGFPGWTTTFDNNVSIHVRQSIATGSGPTSGPTSFYEVNQRCFIICWNSSLTFTDAKGSTFTGVFK